MWWDDADSALHHVVYAPKRLLGYSIESDEDMAPFLYVVYNPDFTEHSEYTEGGHKPDDGGKQADCGYIPANVSSPSSMMCCFHVKLSIR